MDSMTGSMHWSDLTLASGVILARHSWWLAQCRYLEAPGQSSSVLVQWLLCGLLLCAPCRLMPGVDVRVLLARNPDIVMSVQRGAGKLGPGAEFL
mmetsp:Transcript_32262/g.71398  ORF Transcript_32262/g.71398 Transcript_32262/m.71398 type:complete len:95 (+) Transcript_32262:215-499(+)